MTVDATVIDHREPGEFGEGARMSCADVSRDGTGGRLVDTLSASRLDVLRNLSSCPACGARVSAHGSATGRFTALFACTAIFDVADGKPISVLHPCPAPSYVAIAALNREAGAAA